MLMPDSPDCNSHHLSSTPLCNTGVKKPEQPITYGFGWLNFSSKIKSPTEFQAFLQTNYRLTFSPANGFRGYHHSLRSPEGVWIAWTPGREDWHGQIPQTFIDSIGHQEMMRLGYHLVHDYEARASRLDAYLDVPKAMIDYDQLCHAYTNGNYRSRFKNRPKRIVDACQYMESEGYTFNNGSRCSERFLRIYDKEAEQREKKKLATPLVRFEAEFKDGVANRYFQAIFSNPEPCASKVMGMIRSCIDFVNAEGITHISRAKLLPWWQAIVGSADKWTVPAPSPIASVERIAAWIHHQASGALTVLRKNWGEWGMYEFISEVCDRPYEKLGSRYQSLIPSPT